MDSSFLGIFIFSLNVIFDIIGQILFTSIIIVTIKRKELHEVCFILIGFLSFCGLCSKVIILFPYVSIIFPSLRSMWNLCAVFYLLPFSLMHGYFPLMTAISFDRLLSICFPFWYSSRNSNLYLYFMLILSSSYLLYVTFLVSVEFFKAPNLCMEIGFNILRPTMLQFDLAFGTMTILCYGIFFAKVFWNWRLGMITSSLRQILFKSLVLIVFIQIVGLMCTLLFLFIFGQVEIGPELRQYLNGLLNCIISLMTGSEAIALYFTSSEHRSALRKQFPWFFRIFKKNSNSIATVNVVAVQIVTNTK